MKKPTNFVCLVRCWATIVAMLGSIWTFAQPPIAVPDGYAAYAGTTGGGNAAPITVSTAAAFKTAITGNTPAVIYVNGMLNVGDVSIGSNKTVVGMTAASGLTGGRIRLTGSNYIIQNLSFGPASDDVMEVSGATKVFITKCSFRDCGDELLSIVREADFVTVSWCKFFFSQSHSHAFGSLVGNSDTRTSDRGKLHVTMHHNWYENGVRGRMPRVRFGRVHIYNNFFNSPGNGYCIGVGFECNIRLENSHFESVNGAWADYGGASNGKIGWSNLKFVNSTQPTFMPNTYPVFSVPYAYTLDPVDNVKAIVTAGAGNVMGQSNVAVTGVSVSPTTASLNVGSTTQLTATVSPSNATNKNVSWSTSNSSIATVSSTGLVTGVAAGSAVITVTTQDGGKTATTNITVAGSTNIAVTGVTVSPTTASVSVGGTTQLTASVSPSNATNKNVSWSTSNSSIATVSSTGLVTGVAAGSAVITVTTQDGGKTATTNITVSGSTNIAVTGVTVSPTSASLSVGGTTQLTATVSPSNATNKNVSWSTSNSSIATVSSTGLVTGVAAGSAVITVTTQDGGKTATSNITVSTDPLAGYTFCSNEGQTCSFTGMVDIAYGANGQYNYLYNQSSGSVACNNSTFGDPIYGTKKACYVKPVSVTSYTLTTSVSGQGSVSPSSGTFNANQAVTLTATPASGWKFDNWGGDLSGSTNPATLTMSGNKSVTANFSIQSGVQTITLQENQSGICSFDGIIDNKHSGFTGDGFIDTPNSLGQGITWSINTPSAGTYSLVWRYANGTTTNRTAQVMVNGSVAVSSVSFAGTGAWNSWTTTLAVNVSLSAGTHTIRLQATNTSGLANIDNLQATGPGVSAGSCSGAARIRIDEGVNAGLEISIFPNPVSGLLNIEFSSELTEKADILLTDLAGKTLLSGRAERLGNTLDMSGLPDGIYILKILGANLNVTKRIAKQ